MAITIGSKGNEAVLKGDCVVMFPGKYEGNTVKFWLIYRPISKRKENIWISITPNKIGLWQNQTQGLTLSEFSQLEQSQNCNISSASLVYEFF